MPARPPKPPKPPRHSAIPRHLPYDRPPPRGSAFRAYDDDNYDPYDYRNAPPQSQPQAAAAGAAGGDSESARATAEAAIRFLQSQFTKARLIDVLKMVEYGIRNLSFLSNVIPFAGVVNAVIRAIIDYTGRGNDIDTLLGSIDSLTPEEAAILRRSTAEYYDYRKEIFSRYGNLKNIPPHEWDAIKRKSATLKHRMESARPPGYKKPVERRLG